MLNRYKNSLIAVVLLGVVTCAGAWRWMSRGNHAASFRTAQVKRGDVTATISATGTIEPVEVIDVGAQVAGIIKAFGRGIDGKPVDYGSVVAEGALLAQIDESVYVADLGVAQAQLKQDKAGELSARANLEQMRAKLKQTEAEWKRSEALRNAKLMAESDFELAQANFEVAKANTDAADAAVAQAEASTVQAEAAVEKAQRNLDFCTIKSPVRGVIIDRRVNIGQTVVASLNAPSLFLIAKDLTKMQIWVSVNEADVGRIRPGTPVTYNCDAFPGRTFNGTVGKIRLNATMTQNVVMYTVEVNTENPDNVLLPYLTANVHFIVQREPDTLLIPNAALRWSPSSMAQVANAPGEIKGDVIWLKDGELVQAVAVKPGISDGVSTAVASDTLREGQEVVVGEVSDKAQSGARNPFLPVSIKR
jgi:HlyD family secretion protein